MKLSFIALIAGAITTICNMADAQSAPGLVGTWRLVSYEARDSAGKAQYPLGARVSGLIVYDAAGNMSAHIMRNDRPLFAAKDPARGTPKYAQHSKAICRTLAPTQSIDKSRRSHTTLWAPRIRIGSGMISFATTNSTDRA